MDIPINYLAVLVGAVINMAVGFAWYGPLFGKPWMAMMGMTPESMKAMPLSPGQAIAGGVVMSLLLAYVLAHGVLFGSTYTETYGLIGGLTGAFWYWLGFVVPITAGSFLWEGKPFKLWVLNASYYLVTFLVMGAIFGSWV